MRAVITYADGGWYPKGATRLKERLNKVSPDINSIIRIGSLPPNSQPHQRVPYQFKPYAFQEAIDKGFTSVLWLDASCYPVKDLSPLFDIIEKQGYLVFLNGWTTGEWTADSALEPLGVTREELFTYPHAIGGILGFDFTNSQSHDVFQKWKQLSHTAFAGDWKNDKGQCSSDPRVLGHRHDQTAISVLAHKAGWRFTPPDEGKLLTYGQNNDFILNLFPVV